MSNCFRTTNNRDYGLPPRMNDGRHFTDYRPSCDQYLNDQKQYNLSNGLQHRTFYIHNASTLMQQNLDNTSKLNQNTTMNKKNTYLPEQYTLVCDKNTCKSVVNDANGIGTGRHYGGDLHKPLNGPVSSTLSKCATIGDKFNYYGEIDSTIQGLEFLRSPHPRG